MTAFNSGAFDNYNGQPILWIEDFRGEFKLQELLRMIDVYKAEIPSRYNNAKALWTEVHITSVLTPQQCYKSACTDDYDRIEQLERRITSIVYHFKTKWGEYLSIDFPSNTHLVDMENKACSVRQFYDEFIPLDTLCGNDLTADCAECLGGNGATAEDAENETE